MHVLLLWDLDDVGTAPRPTAIKRGRSHLLLAPRNHGERIPVVPVLRRPPPACAAVSFLFIFFLYTKIWGTDGQGHRRPAIGVLSEQIRNGSVAFLTTEYSFLTVFVLALAGTLFGLFYATESSLIATSVSVSFVRRPLRRRRAGGA